MIRVDCSYFISVRNLDENTQLTAKACMDSIEEIHDNFTCTENDDSLEYEVTEGAMEQWESMDSELAKVAARLPGAVIEVRENCEELYTPSRFMRFAFGRVETDRCGRVVDAEDEYDHTTMLQCIDQLVKARQFEAADLLALNLTPEHRRKYAVNGTGFWRAPNPLGEMTQHTFWVDKELLATSIFLHGECGVFALMLAKRFSYPLFASFESSDNTDLATGDILHIYAKVEDIYIDCRGIIRDERRFFQTFSALPREICTREITQDELDEFLRNMLPDDVYDALTKEADTVIQRNRAAYCVWPER